MFFSPVTQFWLLYRDDALHPRVSMPINKLCTVIHRETSALRTTYSFYLVYLSIFFPPSLPGQMSLVHCRQIINDGEPVNSPALLTEPVFIRLLSFTPV